MAAMIQDFVLETANAPGTTASVDLLGAPTGRRTWLSAFSSGAAVCYFLDDGAQAEWGEGTVTSGSPNTLSRDTVVGNTAGGTTRLNFAGSVRVYCALPAEKSLYLNGAGKLDSDLTVTGGLTAEGGSVVAKSGAFNPSLDVNNTGAGGRHWAFIADASGNGVVYDVTGSAARLLINSSGRVTIPGGDSYTSSGAGLLDISGASTGFSGTLATGIVVTNSAVAYNFVAASDRELKSAIAAISPDEGRRFVQAVDPVTYVKHTEADHSDAGSLEAGFVAQDLLGAGFGHMVGAVEDGRFAKGHRLSAAYDQALAYHQAALRGALAAIGALEARVLELERRR